jgi:hypothetical protein
MENSYRVNVLTRKTIIATPVAYDNKDNNDCSQGGAAGHKKINSQNSVQIG